MGRGSSFRDGWDGPVGGVCRFQGEAAGLWIDNGRPGCATGTAVTIRQPDDGRTPRVLGEPIVEAPAVGGPQAVAQDG
ncbi:hypothetical protein GCM10020000_87050 [Streptomyces olivoverticillatus]